MNDIPSITSSSYGSNAVGVHDPGVLEKLFGQQQIGQANAAKLGQFVPTPAIKEQPAMSTARIVKVFIADPNENLPLEKRVLYSGDEKLTDLTDQELFFDVPIADILSKHNEVRKATVDKKQAEKFGRDIFLEPARIRDLKMVVVNIAQF